jgi:hypothetical protein
MTLGEIFVKVALFFGIFYGGILITTFVAKKVKGEEKPQESDLKEEQKED